MKTLILITALLIVGCKHEDDNWQRVDSTIADTTIVDSTIDSLSQDTLIINHSVDSN